MTQGQLLTDYFTPTDKVTVNARELQQVLKDNAKMKRKLKTIDTKLDMANMLLELTKAKMIEYETVKLDVVV